jgi:hypothetical protein
MLVDTDLENTHDAVRMPIGFNNVAISYTV